VILGDAVGEPDLVAAGTDLEVHIVVERRRCGVVLQGWILRRRAVVGCQRSTKTTLRQPPQAAALIGSVRSMTEGSERIASVTWNL
jgi:hypothetical protein